MFRIEMLPARRGDALWIEYGDPAAPYGILIDAGTSAAYPVVRDRILRHTRASRPFELFIVTHVDTDHIGGALRLLADGRPGLEPRDTWVNVWRHLEPDIRADRLGPIDGEIFSTLLEESEWRWNAAFSGEAVVVPDVGPLPVRCLPGGMRLTLLSPGPGQLARLRRDWRDVVRNAGLDPDRPEQAREALRALAARKGIQPDRLGTRPDLTALARSQFVPDSSPANGSTIAVLAEFDGQAVLLAGDGFADVLTANVRRLAQERGGGKLAVDAFKLPHHGSQHNVSIDLLSAVSCSRYLFSTNGTSFGHPDQAAVARVILKGGPDPVLLFNYLTDVNAVWDDPRLRRKFGYQTVYPERDTSGLTVAL
jgi:metallo-beta-lactamase superfamily protein